MTISEACEKALKDLGGRGHLSDIYPRVLKMVKKSPFIPVNPLKKLSSRVKIGDFSFLKELFRRKFVSLHPV